MKKIGYFGALVTFVTFFCYEANARLDPVSKAQEASEEALADLQQQSILTDESVNKFKQKIKSAIKNFEMKEDDDGRIGDQIAIQEDLISLVEVLKDYQTFPTELKAEELREYAMSDSLMAPFIKKIMDQQSDSKFKF